MKKERLISTISIFILLFYSCNPSSGKDTDEARLNGYFLQLFKAITIPKTMNRIADEAILPHYIKLDNEIEKLLTLTSEYEESPSKLKLQNIQNQWRTTYLVFKQVEWVYIGPAFIPQNIYIYIEGFTKSFPIDISLIEKNINESEPPLGIRANGMDAMEYLLFHDTQENIHNQMINKKYRRTYIKLLANNLKRNSQDLIDGWSKENKNSFYYSFTNSGSSNPTYSTDREILNELTNQMVFMCNTIVDLKMGEPSGLRAVSLGKTDISKVENPHSNISLESIIANLEGYELIINSGFGDFLESRNPGIRDRFQFQIEKSKSAIQNLKIRNGNLQKSIQNDLKNVEITLNEIKRLRIFLTTDLVSSLGGTVGVSTNDGD